jgi:hypothetical protein
MGLFVARVQRGSQIILEQTCVGDAVWVPRRLEVRASARIFFVKSLDNHGSSLTRTTAGGRQPVLIEQAGSSPPARLNRLVRSARLPGFSFASSSAATLSFRRILRGRTKGDLDFFYPLSLDGEEFRIPRAATFFGSEVIEDEDFVAFLKQPSRCHRLGISRCTASSA